MLADCDPNGNLDPADAAGRITTRTTGIVVTHMWGVPADMPALRALADAHGLALLEDASHAHGAGIGERKAGTFGDGAALSMNGPKPLSAGEGGFVPTSDDETYYCVLLHGQYNKRCRSEIPKDHPLFQNPRELFPASQGAFAYQPGDWRRGRPGRRAPEAAPAGGSPAGR